MATAKVMDIISRLPGCAGQAADAISAYTQVKMEGAPTVFFFFKVRMNVQIFGYDYHDTNGQNLEPVWRSGRSCRAKSVRSSFGDTIMGKAIRESSVKYGWKKFLIGSTHSLIEKWDILVCVCGRCKTDWKETEHKSELENTHERRWFGRTDIIPWSGSFGLYSTRMSDKQRSCRQKPKYVRIQDFCWDTMEKLSVSGKLNANISTLTHDVKSHANKCVESPYELANKTTQPLHKSRNTIPWRPSIRRRRRNGICWRIVRSLLRDCSEMSFLARIGRPDILWSVNKLARAVTEWTKAWQTVCAFDLLHSSHMWIQTLLSRDKYRATMHNRIVSRFWFCGDFEDSKSTSDGLLCIFGSRTLVSTSWMCKKQTSVSHSSTEAEYRFTHGRNSALNLWDLVIEVFHSSSNQNNKSKGQESQGNLSRNTTLHMKKQNPTKHDNLNLNNVDHVSSNVRSFRFGAVLYVFDDNEAVIKMIIKGRSPTMRHVSRFHRVALDWLFDRINLDPKIPIRNIRHHTSTRRPKDQM